MSAGGHTTPIASSASSASQLLSRSRRRARGGSGAARTLIVRSPMEKVMGSILCRRAHRAAGGKLTQRRQIVAQNGGGGCFHRARAACSLERCMKRLVAIVEDEAALRDNYAAAFTREGYAVRAYANRAQAMQAFAARLPDLVVIDISLEDEPEGGFELCRQLRALSAELPIIFLTARDSELDAVSGLRLGADDFLTKDLSLPHLIARVNALFRRLDALRRPGTPEQILRRGALTLDIERMQAQWDGQVVLLSLTEFWIVHALARHPGHVRSRQQLMDAANVVLDDNTITSHVKRIRRKFQGIDPKFDAVQTAYGMGYRWVE
jgi:two-component system, OmpR family, response regulator